MRIQKVVALLVVVSALTLAGTASAQNYSTDARKIAMGGNGGDSANIAAGMVEKGSPYTAIVIPLGLIQIFQDGTDRFNPSKKSAFDPVRAVEDIANPLHYTFGRGTTTSTGGQTFVTDIRAAKVNTNLLAYKGFRIPTTATAEGLASPTIGGTIKLFKAGNSFQGVYVGVGPYLGFNTNVTVDQKLVDLLGNGTAAACSPCNVTDTSEVQLAGSATVGYRGKLALGGSKRDGLYVAYNYHFLKGFQYYGPLTSTTNNLAVRIDTDANGQLLTPPVGTIPVSVSTLEAKDGTGHASDMGFEVVKGFWEFGFGVNGIGNQIEWTGFKQRSLTLTSLTTGADFVDASGPSAVTSRIVKLPVVKTGNLGFHTSSWGGAGSLTDGYNGKSFNGGLERRVGPLWLRGGGRKSRGKWDPTYGFGIGNKIGLDFGFYGTHANLENKRQNAMAVSIRFNHKAK